MITTVLFGFLAGVISILSPCVLPLIPIVLGTAASQHRYGPLALAGGLALSFTVVGFFVATVGFAMGLDAGMFRAVGAVMLLGFGAVLLLPALQERVAVAAGPVSNWTNQRFGDFIGVGWSGQFAVGLLLGLVWVPCVGPTLGAASLMAARGENIAQVALTMFAFGIGAAVPLLLLGSLSRAALGRMRSAGARARQAMGAALIAVGLMILSGADRMFESWIVAVSPDWLTSFTTAF